MVKHGTGWMGQLAGWACVALAAASVTAWACGALAAAPSVSETVAEAPAEEPTDDTAAQLEGGLARWADEHLGKWASIEVLGVAVWQFLAAFAFILLGLVARKVSDFVMERKVVPFLRRTPFQFDHLLAEAASKPIGLLLLLGGLGLAVAALRLPTDPNVRAFAYGALKVLAAADLVWFLFRLVDVLVGYLTRIAEHTDSKLDDQLVPLVRKALKVTIGVVCGVWVVQLLGYSVSSLLAGLGIGGLAVALALQDTLGNFFGSIFIFLDRPFAVGDMVKVDDVEGVVEHIGFRSTRIRTWPATLVTIPNKHVADVKIDNWSKMPKRRVFQTVGVTYETTADRMEQAVAAVRGILEADEGVDQDFLVVRFSDFGASSLDITVIYFTKAVPYADHLATKERVNLAIMRALAGLGLSIAFPTRTVYFEGDVAKALARRTDTQATSPGERKG